jgi:hypothetical protein
MLATLSWIGFEMIASVSVRDIPHAFAWKNFSNLSGNKRKIGKKAEISGKFPLIEASIESGKGHLRRYAVRSAECRTNPVQKAWP